MVMPPPASLKRSAIFLRGGVLSGRSPCRLFYRRERCRENAQANTKRMKECIRCGRFFHEQSEDWELLHEICVKCCLEAILKVLRSQSETMVLTPGVCTFCLRDLTKDIGPSWHPYSVICIDCIKEQYTRNKETN